MSSIGHPKNGKNKVAANDKSDNVVGSASHSEQMLDRESFRTVESNPSELDSEVTNLVAENEALEDSFAKLSDEKAALQQLLKKHKNCPKFGGKGSSIPSITKL